MMLYIENKAYFPFAKNFSSILIAKIVLINDVTLSAIQVAIFMSNWVKLAVSFGMSKIIIPGMMKRLSIADSFIAKRLLRPDFVHANMEAAIWESPGKIARSWNIPITKAFM